MIPVYVAGRGLVSSLGRDLDAAVAALRHGGVPAVPRTVAEGFTWPFQAMADEGGDWWAQARARVTLAAGDSGALATDRSGPLFIASSSLDIGGRERRNDFEHGVHHFAEQAAGWLGWAGPVFTVSTACTSASNALLSAATLIGRGEARDALVLGIELPNRLTLAGFGSMQLLSPTASRPLGAGRDGLVLGEAVAALHLSCTPSRWRVAGGSNVVDGSDPAGAVQGAVVAMCRQALARSGLQPGDIDLVKLQAAGSGANDATEAAALHEVFTPLPALVSLKATLGHTLGASGAAEIALLTACLETGAWPAACAPDPALRAGLATQPPARVRHVLATILGFGGGHTAVVLEDGAHA